MTDTEPSDLPGQVENVAVDENEVMEDELASEDPVTETGDQETNDADMEGPPPEELEDNTGEAELEEADELDDDMD